MQLGFQATGTELDAIDAAVAGDVQAFAVLYHRHLERVYSHVCYLLSDQADAEEVTQEVFLQAREAIDRYRHVRAPFVAWLLTIAHDRISGRRGPTPADGSPDPEPRPPTRAPSRRRSGQSPPRQDHAAIRQAILRLQPEQRRVVLMRFGEGFTCAEVAAALGKSEQGVRDIQYRALVELRQLLAREVNT